MTAATTNHPTPAYADDATLFPPVPAVAVTGPVLVATDESELAGNAARVALAAAQRLGRPIRVVHVVDTRGVALPPVLDRAVGLADEIVGPAVHEGQCDEVRATLAAALQTPVDWPVRIGFGAAPSVIAAEARHGGAGLLVLGLRRHGLVGRAFHDETALHVARHAACPVLAVAPSLHALPRRVIAAVDFGETSRAAASLARALVAPGGTLTIAHAPYEPLGDVGDGERWVHALGVEAAFARLRDALGDGEVTVETVLLDSYVRRPAGEQLIELAERMGADLVALGSRRHNLVERLLVGSVATDVIRDGRVSVLLVPPSSPTSAG